MRKIALDVGDSKIGIALSDTTCMIACGYETYKRTGDLERDCDYMIEFCKKRDADTIVVGLPYKMDGSESKQTEKTRQFAEKLESYGKVKIDYFDERLTTAQAERALIESGERREKRNQIVDKVAATIILQSYLDKYNNHRKEEKEELEKLLSDMLNDTNGEDDDEPYILTFENEDGKEVDYTEVAKFEYLNDTYIMLTPFDLNCEKPAEFSELSDVCFCKEIMSLEGEEYNEYEMVDDSELAIELYQTYITLSAEREASQDDDPLDYEFVEIADPEEENN
ncbi:MAG: Holliday junction resolvase RuvX [Christensenellaceae bacterium]|jgi:putative Holliday junction resolvase|nr:Holliday junction resolvase RuvX [Christensenellaceae bacterium]